MTSRLALWSLTELSMSLGAHAELEEIDPERQDESKVLALRVRIYSALNKWELMQTVAKVLAQREPDNVQWTVAWAYATRRADRLDAARLIWSTPSSGSPAWPCSTTAWPAMSASSAT